MHAWRDISQYVRKLFNFWNIVLGEETIDDYAEDDNDNFIDRYQYAATSFIQTLESQWLILLATHKTPPERWTALEDTFAREKTSSFFDQLKSVFNTKYDRLDLLSDHINKYDTLWNRLRLLCSTASSPDRYTVPFVFHQCSSHLRLKQSYSFVRFPNQGIILFITSIPRRTLPTITAAINSWT